VAGRRPSPPRPMIRRCSTLAFLLTVSVGLTATAQEAATRQAALVLRILSYDRNLSDRVSGRVTVLVVYRESNGDSTSESRRIASALDALGRRTTVAGMNARAVRLAYTSRSDLETAARREGAAAVYVCEGLASSAGDISRAARGAHMLSLTSERRGLDRGLGVALVPDGSSVSLVVNLPAVEAEGARLDAAVLRLAEVIR